MQAEYFSGMQDLAFSSRQHPTQCPSQWHQNHQPCRLQPASKLQPQSLNTNRKRSRFRIGTRQRSWTRPVAWELIPMTALWAGEGGAQLSQHTAQVGRINRLDRYTCSPSQPHGLLLRRTHCFFPSDGLHHRQYSFYHPTEGRRLSRPSWLAPYCRQSPI